MVITAMELRQLETFVAVAEEMSFSRAAERLHVVQSAVSAGVRTLERELGTPLFARTTHRVELTDAGAALLPEARATLAGARAAREAVEQVRGGLRGRVTLGIMQATALDAVDVVGLLAAFRADHPAVELHVRQAHSAEMAAQVREGRLDFAFLAWSSRRAPGLTLTPVAREPMMLGVHPGHPLAGRADVELTELARRRSPTGRPTGHADRRRPRLRRGGSDAAGAARGQRLDDDRRARASRARRGLPSPVVRA